MMAVETQKTTEFMANFDRLAVMWRIPPKGEYGTMAQIEPCAKQSLASMGEARDCATINPEFLENNQVFRNLGICLQHSCRRSSKPQQNQEIAPT